MTADELAKTEATRAGSGPRVARPSGTGGRAAPGCRTASRPGASCRPTSFGQHHFHKGDGTRNVGLDIGRTFLSGSPLCGKGYAPESGVLHRGSLDPGNGYWRECHDLHGGPRGHAQPATVP